MYTLNWLMGGRGYDFEIKKVLKFNSISDKLDFPILNYER